MHRAAVIIGVLAFFLIGSTAIAQENIPHIVPERLQELAIKLGIAKKLNISWNTADLKETGRYIGLLAAASTVSKQISARNGRTVPMDSDYKAALAILCVWPPHKPLVLEEWWALFSTSYANTNFRGKLTGAIGADAYKLPNEIENIKTEDQLSFPKDLKIFSEKFLHVNQLQ